MSLTLWLLLAATLALVGLVLYQARGRRSRAKALETLAVTAIGAATGVFFALVADREMDKLSTKGRLESLIEAADLEARDFITEAVIIVAQVDSNEYDPKTFSYPVPLKASSLNGLIEAPEVRSVVSPSFQASLRTHLNLIQRFSWEIDAARSASEARHFASMQAGQAYALVDDLKLEREYLKGSISVDSLLTRRRAIIAGRVDSYHAVVDSLSLAIDSMDAAKPH